MTKKRIMLASILLLLIAPLVFTSGTTSPSIYFTDQWGIETEVTYLYNTIFVDGIDFEPETSYDVTLINVTITDGMEIPEPAANSTTMITSDSDGNIPITEIWSQWNGPFLPVGKYTIIVDIDDDGIYDEDIDAIDTIYIKHMTGPSSAGPEIPQFHVPEFPGGSIMAIMAILLAALLYRTQRLSIPIKLS